MAQLMLNWCSMSDRLSHLQYATTENRSMTHIRTISVLGLPAAFALLLVASQPTIAVSQKADASAPLIPLPTKVYTVEHPTFQAPKGHEFKAVFEINAGGADSVKVNAQLVTVGRFYNIHLQHGVAAKHIHAAAVVHGSGWQALLTDEAFAARFGVKSNPSRVLVEDLLKHGAQVVLCGQTAGSREIRREELIPGVQVAISAMTALNVFQAQGYQFNPW